MSKYFSLDELNKQEIPVTKTNDEIARQKFTKMHMVKINTLKQLIGKLPAPDEIIFLWTLNSFNAFTFIPFVFSETGRIDNLVFSTYSINTRIVNSIIRWMHRGKIEHVHIFISDSMKFHMPKVVDLLNGYVTAGNNIKVDYVWNHSKVTLIKANQHHFVIEGSGNFSENAQHEQYVFLNNNEVYNFRLNSIKNAGRNLTG